MVIGSGVRQLMPPAPALGPLGPQWELPASQAVPCAAEKRVELKPRPFPLGYHLQPGQHSPRLLQGLLRMPVGALQWELWQCMAGSSAVHVAVGLFPLAGPR